MAGRTQRMNHIGGRRRSSFNSQLSDDLPEIYYKQRSFFATSHESFVQRQSQRSLNMSEESISCAQSSLWDHALNSIQQFRRQCGTVVNNPVVQQVIVAMIFINALMLGIGTYVEEGSKAEFVFERIDKMFLWIFTLELACQFLFYGYRLLMDGWLVFDLAVVSLSWALSQLRIIRALRIFRSFRLITRIKVMKNLVLELFKDLYDDHLTVDYFGRLDETFFTLFQIMTMDDWATIARQVQAGTTFGWGLFPIIVFVVMTGFVAVNLIIAVICDAVAALRDEDRAKLHGTYDEDESRDGDTSDDASYESPYLQMRERLGGLQQKIEMMSQTQTETIQKLRILRQRSVARQ